MKLAKRTNLEMLTIRESAIQVVYYRRRLYAYPIPIHQQRGGKNFIDEDGREHSVGPDSTLVDGAIDVTPYLPKRRGGDADCVRELTPILRRFARIYGSKLDADDVVQESFLRILLSPPETIHDIAEIVRAACRALSPVRGVYRLQALDGFEPSAHESCNVVDYSEDEVFNYLRRVGAPVWCARTIATATIADDPLEVMSLDDDSDTEHFRKVDNARRKLIRARERARDLAGVRKNGGAKCR